MHPSTNSVNSINSTIDTNNFHSNHTTIPHSLAPTSAIAGSICDEQLFDPAPLAPLDVVLRANATDP